MISPLISIGYKMYIGQIAYCKGMERKDDWEYICKPKFLSIEAHGVQWIINVWKSFLCLCVGLHERYEPWILHLNYSKNVRVCFKLFKAHCGFYMGHKP